MGEFSQCVESRPAWSHRSCCSAGRVRGESKFLNQRMESRARELVANSATVLKIFINSLRLVAGKPNFPNAWPRYGDKWFATRSFSGLFFRVTPFPHRVVRELNAALHQWSPRNRVANVCSVSHEAELHQVKLRRCKYIAGGNSRILPGVTRRAKRKSPAEPGF